MKTVYITDLDGTLLLPDVTLSAFTREALKRLSSSGISVGVSTARTAATVSRIFDGVPIDAPCALMNGACIYDLASARYLHATAIPRDAAEQMLGILSSHCAFVYTVEDGVLSTFYETDDDAHARAFRLEREAKYGKVFTKVSSLCDIGERSIVYASLAGRDDQIGKIHSALGEVDGLALHYYRDIYEKDFFYLEACAAGVSKKSAAKTIRSLTRADRLVAFGDNLNDLSLFDGCDEAIAVANAVDEVKKAADRVIGANTDDAVVRYILEREHIE